MQCKAHTRSGAACKSGAIKGATVCRMHGGGSPLVKAKAAERLALAREKLYGLVDPAIDKLGELVSDDLSNVALRACRDILDRNGFKPVEKLEVTGDLADRLLAGRRRVGLIEGGE